MFILQNGIVEILTSMDKGVDFVIERLFRGAVINHRSFLLNDQIDVSARCVTPVSLFYLDVDDLQAVREKDPNLDREIQRIEDDVRRRRHEGLIEQRHPPGRYAKLLQELRRRFKTNLAVVTKSANQLLAGDPFGQFGDLGSTTRVLC